MTSKEIEKKLSELTAALVESDRVLDSIIAEFRIEVRPLVEKWIKDFVLEAVEDNPDVIHDLGTERLKELKVALSNLFAELPKYIEAETSDRNDWPHLRPVVENVYGGRKNEPFFEKTFRSLISQVAPVLDRFGLRQNFKGQLEQWKLEPNGLYKYALLTGFQEMKVVSRDRFNAKHQERTALIEEIDRAKSDLAKAKARELFESA
ncbi:MAG: hypothetical protein P1U89_10375 [Verrucomicrobiales bacterium]|nr:hypothetical protein [Verrucomicrobiales bacterium]